MQRTLPDEALSCAVIGNQQRPAPTRLELKVLEDHAVDRSKMTQLAR